MARWNGANRRTDSGCVAQESGFVVYGGDHSIELIPNDELTGVDLARPRHQRRDPTDPLCVTLEL